MKTWIRLVGTAAIVVGALVHTAPAALITGSIGFGGTVTLEAGESPANATNITGWLGTVVLRASGTFSNFVALLDPVYFHNSQSWSFNTSTPITNFLSTGGFRFELVSSQIMAQSGPPGEGFTIVFGTGVVSGNGCTPTAFEWAFTFEDPMTGSNPDQWTFSGQLGSANSNGAPVLVCNAITNATVLTWNDPTFTLQSAPAVTGAYTNVPGATSPYTNRIIGPQRYFRLNQ